MRSREGKPREVLCKLCGAEFIGYGNMAMYCKDCKEIKKHEAMQKRLDLAREKRAQKRDYPLNGKRGAFFLQQKETLPACPFWINGISMFEIRCEGTKPLEFESKELKKEYQKKYCAMNPGWEKCPVAKKILEKYKD